MFYPSVPPVPINVLLLTGACLIYNSFVFIVSIVLSLYRLCTLSCIFFMHVCCGNAIKYEYEYIRGRNATPVWVNGPTWTDPLRTAIWSSVFTSRSAVKERPHNALCHWKFCYSWSREMTQLGRECLKFLLVFLCNYVSILYSFWDIYRQVMTWHWNLS